MQNTCYPLRDISLPSLIPEGPSHPDEVGTVNKSRYHQSGNDGQLVTK